VNEAIDPNLPKMIETEGGWAPESPVHVKDTGLDRANLLDLALKTAHVMPQFTTEIAARRMHLPLAITGDLLEQLRTELLLEALGHDGPFGYRYTTTQRGRDRAELLMDISGYIGPAPVSLDAYRAMLEWQETRSPHVTPDQVKSALTELVLPDEAVEIAGLALSSGKSLFLSGPPGNGKTSLGRMLHTAMHGDIWIPHSIAVDSNVIRLFDPHCHQPTHHPTSKNLPVDQRWIKIHRPFIVAGGEMTLESLDLAYLSAQRYYEAPLHMKANGGTFLIDDFGRQRVAPTELLNRWIIPLEHHIDFFSLHSGQKIQVPFLLMLIIATNLKPQDVTDPAFLRRIGYRLRLNTPPPELYVKVFEQYAKRCGVKADKKLIDHVLDRYRKNGRELRCCEPRDLIERVRDICKLRDQPFALNDEYLDLAWKGYFGSESNGGNA
jgi:hypothetical protein